MPMKTMTLSGDICERGHLFVSAGSSFSSVPEAVIGRTQSRASGQHLSGSDPSETSFQSNRMKLNRRLDSSRELVFTFVHL